MGTYKNTVFDPIKLCRNHLLKFTIHKEALTLRDLYRAELSYKVLSFSLFCKTEVKRATQQKHKNEQIAVDINLPRFKTFFFLKYKHIQYGM